jgi:uncharacterized membrane protein YqaE (UPF0057 family)
MDVLKAICTVLIPPLAVALHKKTVDMDLLVNLILTLFLCWIGGVVHAIYVVMQPAEEIE